MPTNASRQSGGMELRMDDPIASATPGTPTGIRYIIWKSNPSTRTTPARFLSRKYFIYSWNVFEPSCELGSRIPTAPRCFLNISSKADRCEIFRIDDLGGKWNSILPTKRLMTTGIFRLSFRARIPDHTTLRSSGGVCSINDNFDTHDDSID